MKKRNMKRGCLIISVAMVASLMGTQIELTEISAKSNGVFGKKVESSVQGTNDLVKCANDSTHSAKKTELKNYNVTEKELKEIAKVAKRDGVKAAEMVNELAGDDFEAAVNRVLVEYYEDKSDEHLKEFENNVSPIAEEMVEGYQEAAEERANADELSYEAGVSLLTFGSNVTEEEIHNIVKDQYGECEYIHKSPDGTYMVKVKNSLGLTVDKAVQAYGEYAETTNTARNDKVEQIVEATELVNDPYAYGQYYLRTMNAVDAWQYIRGIGHSKVKVAVVDGGADLNSVDLRASSDLSAEILSNNTYIPLRQSSAMYNNGHGTWVAGVIAGTANNGAQIAGVASCISNDVAELINIKIEMYVDKIAVGVDYALQCGAKVVNLSLAHDGANDVEEAAINRFVAAGGTVVAGAGNSATDALTYPSDYANVISVVSVDENYNIAGSSNRGWNKDICAPGVGIFVPNITTEAEVLSVGGTSLASPMVAAVVTMMYSVNSGMNSNRVREILINTAKDLGEPGRDYTYAYGFVNAYAAVVSAAGGTVENPTTTPSSSTTMPGYTTANANWTDLNYWSVYFASGWGNNPKGSYNNGNSYSDFGVYVDKASLTAWGVQMKTQVLSATVGTTYICKATATFNSNMTNTITFKDEGTQVSQDYTLVNGTNNFEIEFTPTANNTQIFFDLGMLPEGGNFVITSFSLEEKEQPTEAPTTEKPTTRTFDAYSIIEAEQFASNEGGVIDTNGNASGGQNIGGVTNGTTMKYDNVRFSENAGALTICYSSPAGTASGNAEIYVDSLDNKVAIIELVNNASSWQEYDVLTAMFDGEISAGSHTIYVKYVTSGGAYYVANVDYYRFVKVSEIETPTEEETSIKAIDGGIEVNGLQISAINKGLRTIYSVDSVIDGKVVISSGIVYSLADYVGESEVYVGSSSEYVYSHASTSIGVTSIIYSDSDIATSYAMTMKFATNNPTEFVANWRIRAYAELSDGTYVYTDCYTYTIYEVADYLYKNCKMNTEEHHNYLYDGILSIVDPFYIKKDFNWNNSMVEA